VQQLITLINARFRSAIITRCRESGTSVDVSNIRNTKVILKGETLAATYFPDIDIQGFNKCDCIIYIDGKKAVECFIELKVTPSKISHIIRQFEGGVRLANKIEEVLDRRINVVPVFILVFKGGLDKRKRDKLAESSIRFNGKNWPISFQRIPADLNEFVEELIT